jgi:Na+-driven multidrug efflux pump
MSSVYQAVGYPIRAFLVALSRQLIIFLPVLYIITPFFGIKGVWISFALADGFSGFISLFLYLYEMKIFRRKHTLMLEMA